MQLTPFSTECGVIVEDVQLARRFGDIVLNKFFKPLSDFPEIAEVRKEPDQPRYTCSFDWQPGSVAFWGNRATWHSANFDYQGQRRVMHRITLAGGALNAAHV